MSEIKEIERRIREIVTCNCPDCIWDEQQNAKVYDLLELFKSYIKKSDVYAVLETIDEIALENIYSRRLTKKQKEKMMKVISDLSNKIKEEE